MAIIVDARKLACPQPVVLARKALQDANEVTVVVDNDVAKENVSRLATSSGCHVLVEEKADGTYLHLTKTGAVQQGVGDSPVSGPAVLLIASDFLGRGSEVAASGQNHRALAGESVEGVNFSVVLFYSMSGALRAEKLLKGRGLAIKLISIPRHLSSDCGICLRFDRAKEAEVKAILEEGHVGIQGIHPI